MNIQKTLSAVLSVSMLFTSVGAMPVGNAYAEDDDELSWYDDHYEEIMVGNMYYHAPDKVIYKVGEQLDVTGGTSSGSGGIIHRTKESSIAVGNWDNFGRAYTLDELDLSGFDNTKPGVYEIMPAVKKSTSYTDEIEYSGFSVMVIDGEKSDDNYVSMVGDYEIKPPYDPFLKVGESIEGHYFGGDLDTEWHYEWHHNGKVDILGGDNFGTGIHEYSFDFSEVDNTKPGIYRITPIKEKQRANVDKDEINYGYCYIMVTDGEPTEADKKKLQALNEGIETPPAESVKVTTANVSEVTNVTTITTNTSHNDVMINEENLKVVSVDNGKIKTDDGRTFEFHSWTTSINEVKAGDTISIKGGFHYLLERNIYSECSASLEITDSVVTVKCEHCGKEIPKTEAVYGPLGFPVCRECYENGVYIGTTANFNPQTTTTTTVTTSETTTVSSTSIIYTGDIEFEFLGVNTYPTQTVFIEGEEFNTEGLNMTLRRYIPYEELGFNRADFAPEEEFKRDMPFPAWAVDIIDKNNKKYNGVEFPMLPAGKYTVKIKGDHRVWNDTQEILDADIKYEVEIKTDDRNLLNEKNAKLDKGLYTDSHSYGKMFKGVAAYPEKTVYKKGEALDLTGLIIKVQRKIPKIEAANYDAEPVALKTLLPDTDIITITDSKGKTYTAEEFTKLPVGKYSVSFNSENEHWASYADYVWDVDLAYDIEIKDNASSVTTTTTQPTTSVTTTTAPVTTSNEKNCFKVEVVNENGDLVNDTVIRFNHDMAVTLPSGQTATSGPIEMIDTSVQNPLIIEKSSNKSTRESLSCFYILDSTSEIAESDIKVTEDKDNNVVVYRITVKGGVSTANGDANCDNKLDISDAVLIMQTIANPTKYKLSEQGRKNADIIGDNDGITNLDALQIQKKLLKLI